jgi:hypothetical protein
MFKYFPCDPCLNLQPRKVERIITDLNIGTTQQQNIPSLNEVLKNASKQYLPGSFTTIFYGAAQMSDMIVNPKNPNNIIVITSQNFTSSRFSQAIVATVSFDKGKSWTPVRVSSEQPFSPNNLTFQRYSYSAASFSSDGKVAYVVITAFNVTRNPLMGDIQSGVSITKSFDGGLSWSPLQILNSTNAPAEVNDQPINQIRYMIADRFDPKSVYVEFTRNTQDIDSHSDAVVMISRDYGVTWSTPGLTYNPNEVNLFNLSNNLVTDNYLMGVQPLQLSPNVILNVIGRAYAKPGATTIEFYTDDFPIKFNLRDIVVNKSLDRGLSWTTPSVTAVESSDFTPNSAFPFTGGYIYDAQGQIIGSIGNDNLTLFQSAAVNPCNGTVYVVFNSGIFRPDQITQIGMVWSKDQGKTWSEPLRVNQTPTEFISNPAAFSSRVAVSAEGLVAVTYADYRFSDDPFHTATDFFVAIYQEGPDGLHYVSEERLNTQSYISQNSPTISQGNTISGRNIVPVFHGNYLYVTHTATLDGPFTPPVPLIETPVGAVYLDNNLRQQPHFNLFKIGVLEKMI